MNWLRLLDACRWSGVPEFSDQIGFSGLGPRPQSLRYCRQVHGTQVVNAQDLLPPCDSQTVEADGIFTNQFGVCIGVKTADCLPVLIHTRGFAMALHCGWRGLAGGIIGKGIEEALQCQVKIDTLKCHLLPCIQAFSFEVGPRVVDELANGALDLAEKEFYLVIQKGLRDDRWHVDLQTAAAISLIKLGVNPKNINISRICSFKDSRLQSFRREGKSAGRDFSWIRSY